MVILEHIQDGSPQKLQIILGEAGGLPGEVGRDIALGAVEGVRHDVLAAHLSTLLLGIGLGGDGHAGDGDFLRDDGVHRPGKAQLDGAAHLTAVQRTLDEGGHDGTEGADVEVVLTHIVPQLGIDVGSAFLAAFRAGSMPRVLMASASLRLRGTPSLM